MMKAGIWTAAACLALAVASGAAQAQAQVQAPAPEAQRLQYFVGSWRGEGHAYASRFGTEGELSSHTTCEWFAGGHQLICRGDESGPTGTRQFLNIRAWSAEQGYTEYGVSDRGEAEYTTGGTWEGPVRAFLTQIEMEGSTLQIRYVEEQETPDRFTYRAEGSLGGEPWELIADGVVVRVE